MRPIAKLRFVTVDRTCKLIVRFFVNVRTVGLATIYEILKAKTRENSRCHSSSVCSCCGVFYWRWSAGLGFSLTSAFDAEAEVRAAPPKNNENTLSLTDLQLTAIKVEAIGTETSLKKRMPLAVSISMRNCPFRFSLHTPAELSIYSANWETTYKKIRRFLQSTAPICFRPNRH